MQPAVYWAIWAILPLQMVAEAAAAAAADAAGRGISKKINLHQLPSVIFLCQLFVAAAPVTGLVVVVVVAGNA